MHETLNMVAKAARVEESPATTDRLCQYLEILWYASH